MPKLTALSLVACAALMALPLAAQTVVENWTANRNSYDVHAEESGDRFVIENSRHSASGKIAKFTVKPGDGFKNSAGERSEIVLGGWENSSRFRVIGDEGTEFYRISVKLAPPWLAPQGSATGYNWGLFFQVHGPNQYAHPPVIAIHAEDKFSLFLRGGDINIPGGGRLLLTKSDLRIGSWVGFILKIKWALDASGAVALYRKDEDSTGWEKVIDINNVATLQFKDGVPIKNSHYWKAGFYRSASSHINSLWLGPIVRARTFAEVAGQ